MNIPSLIPHHVIILAVKATDVFGGTFSSMLIPLPFPGDSRDPRRRSVPGQVLASVDYAIPIGSFGPALAFSLASTGASFPVTWRVWPTGVTISRDLSLHPFLYVGGDLTFQMVFNAIPFGHWLVWLARSIHSAPGTFDPDRESGIYLTIGSRDIGAGGLRAGRPLSPGAAPSESHHDSAGHGKTG